MLIALIISALSFVLALQNGMRADYYASRNCDGLVACHALAVMMWIVVACAATIALIALA